MTQAESGVGMSESLGREEGKDNDCDPEPSTPIVGEERSRVGMGNC